jgi:uncharacterized repeat protein (TIGR03803 family)
MLAGRAPAQTFTNLHNFDFPLVTDGANPTAGLILSGNTLYGTDEGGGSNGLGTVFKVSTDGTGFTNVHTFTALTYDPSIQLNTNADGWAPLGVLVLSSNTLYGTAQWGGSSNSGTVFKVNTDGTGFKTLHSFTAGGHWYNSTNGDGANPQAGLILSGNTLYGTAEYGGSSANGTVFAINTDGSGFTNLYSFTMFLPPYYKGNPDGANPCGGLILSGNTLYGTAENGGSSANGTVFAINTDGTGFTNLHSFFGRPSEGAASVAGLILSGNILYGTTESGGTNGEGTVFAINTNGTGFTTLHVFTTEVYDPLIGQYTNADGVDPQAGVILSGNVLYGTANVGGTNGEGTVFAVNTDGTGFTALHTFTTWNTTNSVGIYTNSDGATPLGGLILSGNILYGTAQQGGTNGYGTVFALGLPPAPLVPPSVGITMAGNRIVLSWPTNATSFTLQFITNLSSVNWSNVTSGITIVGTNHVFTNTMNGNASFFRLMQ